MFKFDDFLSSLSRRNLGGLSPSGEGEKLYPGGSAEFDEKAYARPGGGDGDGNDMEYPGEEVQDMSPLPVENTSTPRPLRGPNTYGGWLDREKKLR